MLSLTCSWQDKMKFHVKSADHALEMDAKAPFGDNTAMTPKELLLAGVAGCTAMDVVALLKKYQQTVQHFDVQATAEVNEAVHPGMFKAVNLTFKLTGDIVAEKAIEAVKLSQTKYCGVSAMISKNVPIYYTIEINGAQVGSGQADFSL